MAIKLIRHVPAMVLFFLLASATASAAENGPDQVPLHEAAQTRALVKNRQFEAALAILRPLALAHPERTDILFLLGLAAIESSRAQDDTAETDREALLDEAITALRTILIDQPGLVRVRLELARAFFFKQEDDLARKHFEQVLAGKQPAPVVANVQRFLATIRARRRWSVYLGAAVAPSSNIGRSSDAEIIHINGLPFRRDADQLTTSGVGLSLWTGGEYQYPLADQLRVRMGVDAARQEYSGSKFDQMFLSGRAGPRWLVSRDTEVSLLGNVRQRWFGNAPLYLDYGAQVEVLHRPIPWISLFGRSSWHQRQYRVHDFLDGPILDFSLDSTWLIMPALRGELTVGYAEERARRKNWRNSTPWFRAGVSVALPFGFTLGGSGEFRWSGYRGNWFPFTDDGESRKDRTRILRASVYNRAFTLFGFSPQLVVTNEERKTNAQLYGYRSTNFEVRLVRQF